MSLLLQNSKPLLLRIPTDTFHHISDYLNPIDLLELSLCSPDTAKYVKSLDLTLEKLLFSISDSLLRLCFDYKNQTYWVVIALDICLTREPSNRKSITVDGILIERVRKPNELTFYYKTRDVFSSLVKILEKATENLLSIFNCDNFDLSVWCFPGDIQSLFVWKYAQKFENFCINNERLIERHPELMSQDELNMWMDDVNASKFTLVTSVKNGVVYKRPLRYSIVKIDHSAWLHFDSILTSDRLEEIRLWYAVRPDSIALNEFIRKWMAGELKTIRYMEISLNAAWGETETVFNEKYLREVMRGIEQPEGPGWYIEPFQRAKMHCFIRCVSDGKLARLNVSDGKFEFRIEEDNMINIDNNAN